MFLPTVQEFENCPHHKNSAFFPYFGLQKWMGKLWGMPMPRPFIYRDTEVTYFPLGPALLRIVYLWNISKLKGIAWTILEGRRIDSLYESPDDSINLITLEEKMVQQLQTRLKITLTLSGLYRSSETLCQAVAMHEKKIKGYVYKKNLAKKESFPKDLPQGWL